MRIASAFVVLPHLMCTASSPAAMCCQYLWLHWVKSLGRQQVPASMRKASVWRAGHVCLKSRRPYSPPQAQVQRETRSFPHLHTPASVCWQLCRAWILSGLLLGWSAQQDPASRKSLINQCKRKRRLDEACVAGMHAPMACVTSITPINAPFPPACHGHVSFSFLLPSPPNKGRLEGWPSLSEGPKNEMLLWALCAIRNRGQGSGTINNRP